MFSRMKLHTFDATPKQTPGLSPIFSRRTRNFKCPALHFLAFAKKLTFVEIIHTPALVYRLECDSQNQRQGILRFWSTVPSNHVMSQNKPRDFKIAPKHRGAVGGSSLAQKIKGRASQVYFSPQKVSLMK